MIRMASELAEFEKLVDLSKSELKPAETESIKRRIKHLKELRGNATKTRNQFELLGIANPSSITGYRVPNADKIMQAILLFAAMLKPGKTKLNKLPFLCGFSPL